MHKWLIQIIENEKQAFNNLLNILDRFNVPYDIVEVNRGKIWQNNKEYEFDTFLNYMICGSYQLSQYTRIKRPDSVFSIEDYSFEQIMNIFGNENFVNSDAKIMSSREINWNNNHRMFIRPVEDTKNFNGGVYSKEEFKYNGDVVVATLKNISQEYRFFIIDNKISTASMYKMNGKYETSYPVEESAIQFVENMISKFPEKCFVIDVAKVDNNYKIVELNGLNSAGFYNIDLYKLVFDIEDYYNKYTHHSKKKFKM